MRTKQPLRLAVIALAVTLLAACGSAAPTSKSGADAGPPQSGGTLRVVKQTEPSGLDPARMLNQVISESLIGSSLFGQLLTVDEQGRTTYGLAQSLTTSDKGTTWTLRLRDGLKFTDGTPLDAAAVEFNWARLKDPAVGSPSLPFASFVKSMTPKGQTLAFTLAHPITEFGSAIASDMNFIASPRALRAGAQRFDAKPVGAGPFVLKSWTRGGQMVLARNPKYYDSPRPYLDQLVLTFNTDTHQMFASQQAGQVDAVASSATDLLKSAEQRGLTVAASELGGGTSLTLNARQAPFDDVRARRAVLMGVDRRAIDAAVYQDEATVPKTLFADGSPYNGDTTLPTYDKAAAQKLFDQLAAEGKPVRFTITTYQVTQLKRVAEAIQAQLDQYRNVHVEVEALDYSTAVTKTVRHQFQSIISAVTFDRPSPRLYTMLATGQSNNIGGVSSPALDAALSAAMSAADEKTRRQANEKVAALFNQLAPALLYTRSVYGLAYGHQVHGVELYARSAIRTDTLWMSK
ncbi:ABC transporter substrate-binding protein [Streptomyces sp. NPDC090075]|uniref:ABC transporter substrate-binding protein n=1 Tax=Streptomyces sp. NPDC090075 TaxID=3365937 RepID=UPI0037FF4425